MNRPVGLKVGFISGYQLPFACTTLPRNRPSHQILPSSISTNFYFHQPIRLILEGFFRRDWAFARQAPSGTRSAFGGVGGEHFGPNGGPPYVVGALGTEREGDGSGFLGQNCAHSKTIAHSAPACPSYTGRGPPGPRGGQWPPMASNEPVNSPVAACILPW